MQKKIAITKNGYDILRIVQGKTTEEHCEFKIIPMVEPKDTRICYMKLFSEPEEFKFDKEFKFEITYHIANEKEPAKIHIKIDNKELENPYKTIPVSKLIEPNIKTEIPIPLFKLIIPDEVLTKKYKHKKEHKEFNIKENNIIEVFMKRAGDIGTDNFEKWQTINTMLNTNSLQYLATGLEKYAMLNYNEMRYSVNEEHMLWSSSMSSDISDRIALEINTLKSVNVSTNKLDFLFIENEAYLGLLTGRKIYDEQHKNKIFLYEKDLENSQYFNQQERKKWIKFFENEKQKTDKLIIEADRRYQQQFERQQEEYEEMYKLLQRVKVFKDEYKKNTSEDLLFCAQNMSSLLAQYLGMEDATIFMTTFKVSNYLEDGSDIIFDEVLLEYKDYTIDVTRGELNRFLKNKSEQDILILDRMTIEQYLKVGFCRKLLDSSYDIQIIDQGMYRMKK